MSSPQQEIKVEQRQTIPAETTIVQQPVQPQPAPVQQPSPIYTAPVQGQQPSVPIFTPAAVIVHGVEIPPPVGSRYAPVSTGGFICIFLMMLLPIVNLILLIVWACGGCRKVNQSNLAKAMLVLMLIGIVLSVLIVLIGGLFLSSMGGLDSIKDSIINKAMEAAGE
ncbi:MAG: zinc ribbon domain-containing protein [Bacteroidales bacterium]|nr:zinc ribbon domain-containing protein [Bacteroidales bacterium]